jgi:hypothetical protein
LMVRSMIVWLDALCTGYPQIERGWRHCGLNGVFDETASKIQCGYWETIGGSSFKPWYVPARRL